MLEGDRDPGATFASQDIGFLDFESRSRADLKRVGAYKYAQTVDATVLAYAIGDAPVQIVQDGNNPLHWDDMPREVIKHHERVRAGKAKWCAWNAAFDRAVWNFGVHGSPLMHPEFMIDAAAQAAAAGLAPDLRQSARLCGAGQKEASGKALIELFCTPGATATAESHPEEWAEFAFKYARSDVIAMRDVFWRTRQLSMAEWQEYWAMEHINERGVFIDLPLAYRAAALAEVDGKKSNQALYTLTRGDVQTVNQIQRLTNWLLGALPAEGREILTKRVEEIDEETGEIIKPAKFALRRSQVVKLLAYVDNALESLDTTAEYMVLLMRAKQVLQIRLYGGSKTPMKFKKMIEQHVGGALMGQYVFNGAAQTGRASSRGVQVHNLARDTLPYERQALEAVLNDCDHDALAGLGNAMEPVARKLSLLIRPTFVPRNNNIFVWSDWSNIEARILPWLAGEEGRLDLFRAVDLDPSIPDLYTRTTSEISHIPIAEVTKPLRQRGKVVELALGFGGGVGALQAMAAGYGMHITDTEAKTIVERWRAANVWAVRFWGRHDDLNGSSGLWGALNRAIERPGEPQSCGRLVYVYQAGYLSGSLLCMLPSGRFLTYRDIRYERVADLDDDDKIIGYSIRLRFARGYGERVKFWHGMAVENVVQAVAADILRGTLVRLENLSFPTRLHTHDEVLGEVPVDRAELAQEVLRGVMQKGFDWSAGLPLMSEETMAYYYTKSKEDHGL